MLPAESPVAALLKSSLQPKSPSEPILPPYRPKPGQMESGSHSQRLLQSTETTTELQWVFVRKVYSTLAAQLLVAVLVSAFVVFDVWPIAGLFDYYADRLGLSIFLVFLSFVVVPFVALGLLYYYRDQNPLNLALLVLFTLSIDFGIGLISITSIGKVIFEYAILTIAVVISLTLYTFFAAKRGHEFSLLNTFLFAISLITVVFAFVQILFPLGKASVMIYSAIAAIIFCGYILNSTDNLVKRSSLDDFVPVAASLYFAIICLRNCWNENDRRRTNLMQLSPA